MKTELTHKPLFRKLLRILLLFFIFLSDVFASFLRSNARRKSKKSKTTDDLFQEMYQNDPSIFDSRRPRQHRD